MKKVFLVLFALGFNISSALALPAPTDVAITELMTNNAEFKALLKAHQGDSLFGAYKKVTIERHDHFGDSRCTDNGAFSRSGTILKVTITDMESNEFNYLFSTPYSVNELTLCQE